MAIRHNLVCLVIMALASIAYPWHTKTDTLWANGIKDLKKGTDAFLINRASDSMLCTTSVIYDTATGTVYLPDDMTFTKNQTVKIAKQGIAGSMTLCIGDEPSSDSGAYMYLFGSDNPVYGGDVFVHAGDTGTIRFINSRGMVYSFYGNLDSGMIQLTSMPLGGKGSAYFGPINNTDAALMLHSGLAIDTGVLLTHDSIIIKGKLIADLSGGIFIPSDNKFIYSKSDGSIDTSYVKFYGDATIFPGTLYCDSAHPGFGISNIGSGAKTTYMAGGTTWSTEYGSYLMLTGNGNADTSGYVRLKAPGRVEISGDSLIIHLYDTSDGLTAVKNDLVIHRDNGLGYDDTNIVVLSAARSGKSVLRLSGGQGGSTTIGAIQLGDENSNIIYISSDTTDIADVVRLHIGMTEPTTDTIVTYYNGILKKGRLSDLIGSVKHGVTADYYVVAATDSTYRDGMIHEDGTDLYIDATDDIDIGSNDYSYFYGDDIDIDATTNLYLSGYDLNVNIDNDAYFYGGKSIDLFSDSNVSVTGDTLKNNGIPFYFSIQASLVNDTFVVLDSGELKKIALGETSVVDSLALKLNISDTSAFARDGDLTAKLNTSNFDDSIAHYIDGGAYLIPTFTSANVLGPTQMKYSESSVGKRLYMNSNDGYDSLYFTLGGGGYTSTTRGAFATLGGNESSYNGNMLLWAGGTTGGIYMYTNGGSVFSAGPLTITSYKSHAFDYATANRVPYLDVNKTLQSSSVSSTTLGYLDATSSIQTQLNSKLNISDTSVFARDGDLAAKLNISDTSVFARDGDLAAKLNISDTSVFARDGDLAAKLNISDTSVFARDGDLAAKLNTANFDDSIGHYIDGYEYSIPVFTGTKTISDSWLRYTEAVATRYLILNTNDASDSLGICIGGGGGGDWSRGSYVVLNGNERGSGSGGDLQLVSGGTGTVDIWSGGGLRSQISSTLITDNVSHAFDYATASRATYLDANKVLQSSSVSSTTLGYLDATSSIQTQLNSKLNISDTSAFARDGDIAAKLNTANFDDSIGHYLTSGTFTFYLGGFSGTPSGLASYVKVGQLVTIMFEQTTGTSNNNIFYIYNIPAAIRPSSAKYIPCPEGLAFYDNGGHGIVFIQALVQTDGRIDFAVGSAPGDFTYWSSSGTKGIANMELTYTTF